ncbi:MAG: RtcB family protein [Armatimonadetes bacterium]|nr:RtcB family protein [Candidatus Hippobium faecium]
MQKLVGKFNEAKVFTNNIDTETVLQIKTLLNQEFAKDSKIRIMPDTHAGKGCVIGTTMTLTDRAVPNLVGVDIGCGMLAAKLNVSEIDFQKLDKVIRKKIPSGVKVRGREIAQSNADKLFAPVDIDRAFRSLGTLGGGNHFIEVDTDKNNNYWLVIHTGSRHLGVEVCEFYQNRAWRKITGDICDDPYILKRKIMDAVIKLKAEKRDRDISKTIQQIKSENKVKIKQNGEEVLLREFNGIPIELAYTEGEDFQNYIHDMKITQEHACINRAVILNEICQYMEWTVSEKFETIHNYIDTEKMILRKGAVSAEKGEKLIIPMNMRDGSLICIGKGNEDWNCSAPHGAGRIMSRAQAKEKLNLADFRDPMKGIWTSCVQDSTIDEAPMVYKPMDEIVENVKDTVDIIDIIKPVYNFKAN